MDLCDWAAIAALVALWPNKWSYELTWFWSLSGTLQALLTPELAYSFPDLRFIVFFGFPWWRNRSGPLSDCAFMRPLPGSLPRVIAWSFSYFIAAPRERDFHTNFGYLRAKPANPRCSICWVHGPSTS